MKNIQKLILVGVLAASLVIGVIGAFAESSPKDESAAPVSTMLTRKVNEYEGQH